MWIPPLMVLPLGIYNLVAFGLVGVKNAQWAAPVFSLDMVSGAIWTLSVGDFVVVLALFCLFVEIVKSTRTDARSILDHMLSTAVFAVFLVEFLVVPAASTSLFFILMTMSLIDLVAGFSISIRGAGRDVNLS